MVRAPSPQGILALATGVLPSVWPRHETLASLGSVTTRALQPPAPAEGRATGTPRFSAATATGAGSIGGAGTGSRGGGATRSLAAGGVGATAFCPGIALTSATGWTCAAGATGATGRTCATGAAGATSLAVG